MGKNSRKISPMIIEQIAVNSLERKLMNIEDVVPSFNKSDKSPLFDGHIYFSNSSDGRDPSIENMSMMLKVQIKGTTKKNVNSRNHPYSALSKNYLKKLQENGGCFFFVIYISEIENKPTFFYSALTPIKIENILKFSKGKKTTTLHLLELPTDPKEVYALLRQGLIDFSPEIAQVFPQTNSSELTTTQVLTSKQFNNLPQLFDNREIIVYSMNNGIKTPAFIMTKENTDIFTKRKFRNIKFPNGNRFSGYATANISEKPLNSLLIRTGLEHKIKLTLDAVAHTDKMKISISIDSSDNIDNEIFNVGTLLSLRNSSVIEFDDNKLPIELNYAALEVKSFFDKLDSRIKELNIIKEASKKTHIDLYNTNNFNEEELKTRNNLLGLFQSKHRETNPFLFHAKFKNDSHIIIITDEMVCSLYSPNVANHISARIISENTGKPIIINPFLNVTSKIPIEKISDFNPNLVISWFKNNMQKINDPETHSFYNNVALNLIHAYDTRKIRKFADLAIYILKIIEQLDPDNNIYFLNHMQTIVRINRQFHAEEIARLTHLMTAENIEISFGAKVILSVAHNEIFKDFIKLSPTLQKGLQHNPIWELMDKNIKKKILDCLQG
ncbi:MAG: hypothetical protein LKF36_08090 [Lactobacillus sp.]|jgi:hypothetical protein|nr:hypothetical protein [Lactobacillus sp.]